MSAEPVRPTSTRALTAAAVLLQEAVDRCADALLDSQPPRRVHSSVYEGDAGTALALAQLAIASERSDLMHAAQLAAAAALGRLEHVTASGLLHGRAGVLAAAATVERLGNERLTAGRRPSAPPAVAGTGADLASGVAGILLGQLVTGAGVVEVTQSVRALARMARASDAGFSWASGPLASGPRGPALSGMAHGASGIAVALSETAARHPGLARPAAGLAAEAVRWESEQFDRRRGGWPDRRDRPPTCPVSWCNGAAGIGAARLRMLQLAAKGTALDVAALEADALRAVRACMLSVGELERSGWDSRSVALAGGLGLCHGLGGVLDTLALATEVWRDDHYLGVAQRAAVALVAAWDDEPLGWPGLVPGPLGPSLHLGLAGTALVLGRLAYPDSGITPATLLF